MLNIRNVILSVVLVVLLLLAVPLVTARTEAVSNPAGEPVGVQDNSEVSVDQRPVPIASYRSRLDECFDVPVAEAAECRAASQVLIPTYRSPNDECFDVSLRELASCREASQASAP